MHPAPTPDAMRILHGWCFGLVLLLVLGIQPVTAQSSPAFEFTDCWFSTPANQTVDCGYLTVPENYAEPDARQIRLAVMILRHPSDNPEPDPLIYLEGGPGGRVLTFAADAFSSRYEPFFAANRDIILFDQRGVGYSEPALECADYFNLEMSLITRRDDEPMLTHAERNARRQQGLMACGAALSAQFDLSQYNSANSARDVEHLRIALGYEQVNLWSVSYGTRLALTMMRDYPHNIRSAVLDSAYPLEVNLFTDTPANWSRALDALFAACANDENCHAAYPDLRQTFLATVDELNANPQALLRSSALPLDGVAYHQVTFARLYNTGILPYLPHTMTSNTASNRRLDALAFVELTVTLNRFSIGMNTVIQCHEELAFTERGAIQAAYQAQPLLAGLVAYDTSRETVFDICTSFNAGQAPAIENEPVTSDIPTLILAGYFDPITPPQWGHLVHDNLANSFYVEFPTLSHAVLNADECPRQIAIDFFSNPDAQPDATCVESMQMFFYVPESDASVPTM